MQVILHGRGTARPDHAMSQSQAAEVAACAAGGGERQRRLLHTLFRQAGVERRGSVLLSEPPSGAMPSELLSFYPVATPGCPSGPPVRERMAAYHTHAAPLAAAAARRALAEASCDPADIGEVVAVSCTGLGAPGLDIALIETLRLAPETGRTMIGFMGCHGLLNGLRVARSLALADPGRAVLLCAVELCSLHYQYARDPREAVADALFGDGAAAMVLQAGEAVAEGPSVRAVGSCLLPDSAQDMTWRIGNHGFEMTLSPRVPKLIEQHLAPWLRAWLARHGLALEEVGSWAIHPGGPRVLDAVGEALGLDAGAVEPSRRVLAEDGNMSSPTLAFILERLRRATAPAPTVLLAFGPGLVAEAALLD